MAPRLAELSPSGNLSITIAKRPLAEALSLEQVFKVNSRGIVTEVRIGIDVDDNVDDDYCSKPRAVPRPWYTLTASAIYVYDIDKQTRDEDYVDTETIWCIPWDASLSEWVDLAEKALNDLYHQLVAVKIQGLSLLELIGIPTLEKVA